MRESRYFVGLDLGQAQDFTALAVLERPLVYPDDGPDRRRPAYALRHLCRHPPGTPYAEVIDGLRRLLRAPGLAGATVVVDQTGVGGAVVGLLEDGLRHRATCHRVKATITAGHELTAGVDGGLYVPRKELVGALQVLLQTRRLHIARALPDAALLARELEGFRATVTVARPGAAESWREGQHDDLVLAVALAAWAGERGYGRGATPPSLVSVRPAWARGC